MFGDLGISFMGILLKVSYKQGALMASPFPPYLKKMFQQGPHIFAICLLLIFIGCARSKKPPKTLPDPPSAPFTFALKELKTDPPIKGAPFSAFIWQANATVDCWYNYHLIPKSTGIIWFPTDWPKGEQALRIWVRHTDANSADGRWASRPGRFAMWVKGWWRTRNIQTSQRYHLGAVCHRLGHLLCGCGSATEESRLRLIREICPCPRGEN